MPWKTKTINWSFDLEDGKHTIILKHSFDSTRVITLDNKVMIDKTPVNNLGFEYEFDCKGHSCVVKYIVHFFSFAPDSYECWVDGKLVEAQND